MFSLSFWASSLLTILHICDYVDTQDQAVEQPLKYVTAAIGDSAVLPCRVKENLPIGPVKWFKGTKPNRQFIFSDKASSPRIHKINNTNFVWDICIHNITDQDAGMYYCVKFRKAPEEEYQSGSGTFLSIAGSLDSSSSSSSSSSVVLTAAIAVSLALILILLVLCYYFKRSKGPSPCLARLKTSKTNQSQKEPAKNREIVYADLHIRKDHRPRSPAPEPGLHSEYATIHIQ
ncbi:tyrosine-protein phosphatase non-receptor type substrate 1-like [Antechinus flavipes]|uniref:tyrosine-protein phosphatase non-receptor type substrate 1-like n=1 Tax=Antechinus flavipes TaxID=38775 RepID=UPI00223598F7|nr:tyrosine-protein phosphatase non-receptor type substrate 1-like [Antechinus flavipes]